MFPVLIIAIGIVVLVLGKRLSVLGAAVGALLGVGLLRLFNIDPLANDDLLLALAIVGGLALGGFFLTAAVGVVVNIVLMVLGALAGAAIVMGFLDLFAMPQDVLYWILAVAGGAIGIVLERRFKELALIILAGLVGGLLVTHGLKAWFTLDGTISTLIVLVLAGGSIAFQSGFLARRSAAQAEAAQAAQAQAAAQPQPAAPAPAAAQTPPATPPQAAPPPQPTPEPQPVAQAEPPAVIEPQPAPPPTPSTQPIPAPEGGSPAASDDQSKPPSTS